MGREEVWVGALAYGQAKPTAEDLQKLSAILGWKETALTAPGEGLGEEFMPVRGQDWDGPPRDPLLYRLYEVSERVGFILEGKGGEKGGK